MATLRDVADKANVSIATVSAVINRNKYVSPELTERVKKAIQELNYKPNGVARGLRTKRSYTLGLVISDITNPFFPEIARGVEDRADRAEYSVFLSNTDADPRREARCVENLRSKGVDGIIFTSIRTNDESVRRLHEEGFPFVLINRQVENLDLDYVGVDNERGAYKAVKYLISLGHERIGYIGGAIHSTASKARHDGYRKALEDHGIEYDPALVEEGYLKQEGGYAAARRLLAPANRPTAIFAANDLMALGVLDVASDLHLRVPEDLAVVGFDDIKLASQANIQLTTVRQPRYEMGQLAVDLLLERLDHEEKRHLPPQKIILPCDLVVRKTAGPPPRQV